MRQTVGLVASLIQMASLDWPVPDWSTLCRRQARISVQIPCRRAGGPLNLLIDSTAIRFRGDGEGLARKHGATRRREWRKVHLAMDTATGDIRAVEFTSSHEGDSALLPDLLTQIPEREGIETVTADGAYDTRRCLEAILARGAEPVIPVRRIGRMWKPDFVVAEFRAGSEFPLSPAGLSYALNLGSAEGIEAVHQRDADLDFGGLTIGLA